MRIAVSLDAMLVAACVVAAAYFAVRVRAAMPSHASRSAEVIPRIGALPTFGRDSAERFSTALVSRPLFRIGRPEASIAPIPTAIPTVPANAPAAAPAPVVVLKAVAGGPPWLAVLRGLPGTPADLVVRVGDRFDELVIRAITRDAVMLGWRDSTWTVVLAGREP